MPISKPVQVFYPLNTVHINQYTRVIYVTHLNAIPGNFNLDYFTRHFIVNNFLGRPKLWHGYQHQYHHRKVVGPKDTHQGLRNMLDTRNLE